jgi:DNA-binding PadR family transcriptional regulator
MTKKKKNRKFTEREVDTNVDDIYSSQKKYQKTKKGKAALNRARKAYDERDPQRRRRQKREYMKRKRAEKRQGLKEYY